MADDPPRPDPEPPTRPTGSANGGAHHDPEPLEHLQGPDGENRMVTPLNRLMPDIHTTTRGTNDE
jgi:hypothetical protein